MTLRRILLREGASEIVWYVRAKWLWLWWGPFCFSQSSPQPRHLGCKSWRWRSWWWWWWWWWGTSSWEVYCERSENCKIWLLRMPNLDFANFWTTQHPRQRSLALINLCLCPARGSTNWLNQSFGQIWGAPFTIYSSGYPNTNTNLTKTKSAATYWQVFPLGSDRFLSTDESAHPCQLPFNLY